MIPKVTIIIPCYNAEKWVRQCVVSALKQDYESIEVIAVDNESTDRTREVIINLQKEHPALKIGDAPNLYKHTWDEARNEALTMATGDYVTFVCSDDYLESDYISNCMKYILLNPTKIKILQSAIKGVDESGLSRGDINHFYSSLDEFKKLAIAKCPVNTPTVIYNMELYHAGALKTYPEKYSGAADYDLYCSLADKEYLIYPANRWLGYYYRWHPGQATWGMHQDPVKYDKIIQEYWRARWT